MPRSLLHVHNYLNNAAALEVPVFVFGIHSLADHVG